MLWLGIAVTVLGFVISLLSLTITTSVGGRMVIVLDWPCGHAGWNYRTHQPARS